MVTRRDALRGIAAAGVAAALVPLAALTALAAEKRPNILWISCEDISPHLGCYGDRFAKTPNLDQLASEGIRYTRAYTVAGVCAPSRSGIITGMYPSTLGSQHMRCKATLPDFVRGFPEYLRKAGYYTTNCSKTDYNAKIPSGLWDESSRKAHWKKRPKGKPFFAVFNHTGTHESTMRALTPPRGLKPGEKQDPAALDLPPHYPDTPNSRQNLARAYETTTVLDHLVAGWLKELDDAGLADDTIVFFWSDHGDGLPRGKRWLYETGTHVPLIVRIPEKFRAAGQGVPGTVDERLVNFIDLGPTVLNRAGVDVPKHMQGRAFLGADLPPAHEYIFGARCRIDERYDIIRTAR
ncbi:MAG: sulfatase family protein, partial [Planctomycetota bacterium]